jgi:hypothetical protein
MVQRRKAKLKENSAEQVVLPVQLIKQVFSVAVDNRT